MTELLNSGNEGAGGEFKRRAAVKDCVLAFETGVGGGSLALMKNNAQIDGRTGRYGISRAEDVLDDIAEVLKENKVSREMIGLVAVSSGPGSFTGLRIGAAIAKGLRRSLDCRVAAESVMTALSDTADEKRTITAVPFGSRQVCWQYFDAAGSGFIESEKYPAKKLTGKINISEKESFRADTSAFDFEKVVLHNDLYEFLSDTKFSALRAERTVEVEIVNAGSNLALYIGKKAYENNRKNSWSNFDDDFELVYPVVGSGS